MSSSVNDFQFQSITALHWLLHFRIFIHVPLEGSIPYDALAAQADVPETRLKSVIRLAMTNGMFAETTPDTVEHTSFSIFFAKNPDQVAANLFSFEVTIPTAMKMVAATERWPDSVEKNQTAHNIAFGHDTSYFEWLSADDARTKQFAMYMRSVAGNQSMDVRHLVNAFGIQELPASGIVVDVSTLCLFTALLTRARLAVQQDTVLSPWHRHFQTYASTSRIFLKQ